MGVVADALFVRLSQDILCVVQNLVDRLALKDASDKTKRTKFECPDNRGGLALAVDSENRCRRPGTSASGQRKEAS